MKLCSAILCTIGLLMGAACDNVTTLSAQPAPVVYAPPPPQPVVVVPAQAVASPPVPMAVTVAAQAAPPPPLPPGAPIDPLEQLVAPIALYPDALVALILPASTSTADIVLAARYLEAGGNPNDVDSRAWDDSVKGLTRYPQVIQWMNDNLEWTQQLGAAYVNESENVMAAVQRARARARANGTLVDNAEQQVVYDNGYIRIIPAQPTVIYVPQYDPEIIFVDQSPDYYPGPLITFGPPCEVGFWLSYGCDWGGRAIWIDRHAREHWREHRDWRRPDFPRHPGDRPDPNWHTWRPAPNRPHPPRREIDWSHRPIVHPVVPPTVPRIDRDTHGRPVVRPPVHSDDRRNPASATRPGEPRPGRSGPAMPPRDDRSRPDPARAGTPPSPSRPPVQPGRPPQEYPRATPPEGNRPVRPAPQPAQPPEVQPRPQPAPSRPAPAPQPATPSRPADNRQYTPPQAPRAESPRPAPADNRPQPVQPHQEPHQQVHPQPAKQQPQPQGQQKEHDHDQDKQK